MYNSFYGCKPTSILKISSAIWYGESNEWVHDDDKILIRLDNEFPESFLVENFCFHQSPRLGDFPINLLIAYQRGNVVSGPRCPVDIPRVTPSDRYQLNVSYDMILM